MDKLLYLIVDFSYGKEKIRKALSAGVDYVQLREKNISSAEYLARAKQMRILTREYHTKLIIDDRVDIALLSGADGVHVGQTDIPVADIRNYVGSEFIIGATAKTVSQAVKAEQDGANYLGTGAFFETKTKSDALPISEEMYRDILLATTIPNIAIGGITVENCDLPLSLGASGVAVSAGIMGQKEPEQIIHKFREKLCEQ